MWTVTSVETGELKFTIISLAQYCLRIADETRDTYVLAVVLVGVVVEGVIALTWANVIPTCGCQNTNGQPYHWCPVTPCPSREALNIDSSKLNSPTNMTL